MRTEANGCAVIRRPVLIVAVVRPFVGIGTRRVLGERGGVVGFGEKPEDGKAYCGRGAVSLVVLGYLGEWVARPGSLGGLGSFGGSRVRGASAWGVG